MLSNALTVVTVRDDSFNIIHYVHNYKLCYIPLLGGCYGKSCKLNGQHTRTRNHSAISRVVTACTLQVIAPWSRINDIHNGAK